MKYEQKFTIFFEINNFRCSSDKVFDHMQWNQVFSKNTDADTLLLLAARASRVENQDAINASIVGMLGDPKEVNNILI